MSSKSSSSQRVLGLPIGLLDMGFRLSILCTILSSAMRSTWPNQFSLHFLINPIIFILSPCVLLHSILLLLPVVDLHVYVARFDLFYSAHFINPLNPELNPICYLLALLAHHFLHVSRIMVKSLPLRLLMSYVYMEHLFLMFLDHIRRRSTVGMTPLDE